MCVKCSTELQDMQDFMKELDTMSSTPAKEPAPKPSSSSMCPPPALPYKKKALHESGWVGSGSVANFFLWFYSWMGTCLPLLQVQCKNMIGQPNLD